MIINFVSLFYSVAIVSTISNGLQPIFSFILVFLASRILPDIFFRKYRKKELLLKLFLCVVSFVLLSVFYYLV